MNFHRAPGRTGVRLPRPAVLVSAAAASLALTGLAAPAFAAAGLAVDPPGQSKDCGGRDDRRSAHCGDHKGGISYELQSRTSEITFTVQPGTVHNGSLACDSGWLIDSGGYALSTPPPVLAVQKSIKGVSESWETTVVNTDAMLPHTYDLVIVCSRLVAVQH
ncbi:hypothetical protein ACIPW5_39595 [Streptomyces sp. NPDC090077]|uniref:hypothetical protein n=1 Tax=Streptomyces sp. NPDC090077 TaxID=3365938 RepID=UPI003823419F